MQTVPTVSFFFEFHLLYYYCQSICRLLLELADLSLCHASDVQAGNLGAEAHAFAGRVREAGPTVASQQHSATPSRTLSTALSCRLPLSLPRRVTQIDC
jgi:hypothetical protein